MKYLLLAIAFASFSVHAQEWTPNDGNNIKEVTRDADGNLYLSLEGFDFSGCTNTDSAIIPVDQAGFRKISSILDAAKISSRPIRASFDGCKDGYSVIQQAYML